MATASTWVFGVSGAIGFVLAFWLFSASVDNMGPAKEIAFVALFALASVATGIAGALAIRKSERAVAALSEADKAKRYTKLAWRGIGGALACFSLLVPRQELAVVLLVLGLALILVPSLPSFFEMKARWKNTWDDVMDSVLGTPARAASLVATLAVIVGFANLPYAYYRLLRLGLCTVSLFLAFGGKAQREDWLRWVLGFFAFLYNPVLPVRIGDKGVWEILNVASVIAFWVAAARHSR